MSKHITVRFFAEGIPTHMGLVTLPLSAGTATLHNPENVSAKDFGGGEYSGPFSLLLLSSGKAELEVYLDPGEAQVMADALAAYRAAKAEAPAVAAE